MVALSRVWTIDRSLVQDPSISQVETRRVAVEAVTGSVVERSREQYLCRDRGLYRTLASLCDEEMVEVVTYRAREVHVHWIFLPACMAAVRMRETP